MDSLLMADCETLLSDIKQEDKMLCLKRRWLMDLQLTPKEAKEIKQLVHSKDMFLPESLLRADDVSYENLRASVETGIKHDDHHNQLEEEEEEAELVDEYENYAQLFSSRDGLRRIFSMVDEMTNKGLCLFVEILTGGSVKYFDKTNQRMKKIIKKYCLSSAAATATLKNHQDKSLVAQQLSKLLRDPKNFRGNHQATRLSRPSSKSKSYRDAAKRIIDDELESFPFQTLSSMHRKLRSVSGYIPQLQPPKSGWGHGALVNQLRKKCGELLGQLGNDDESVLQEPLANALAIAVLTLKLSSRRKDDRSFPQLVDFREFSPKIQSLQNDIIKAIRLLDDEKKVSFTELKDILLLLDPNAKLTKRIRIPIRNLFIEFLLECADMETIPKSFLEALAIIIKKRPRQVSLSSSSSSCDNKNYLSKEELEEEVESVLALSAQSKQIIWDLLVECDREFDKEFANAYLEDDLESDDGDDDEQQAAAESTNFVETKPTSSSRWDDPYDRMEGMGESNPNNDDDHPNKTSKQCSGITAAVLKTRSKIENIEEEMEDLPEGNEYLGVQEACDRTSVVAYHLIGCLLNEFAAAEGLELNADDVSYLQPAALHSGAYGPTTSSKDDDAHGSMLIRVLQKLSNEELMTRIPDSTKDKLLKMMATN